MSCNSLITSAICHFPFFLRSSRCAYATAINAPITSTEPTIASHGTPVFFSSEALVQVEVFAASDTVMLCPRCEKPLEDGTRVVRCPACSLAFHYSGDDKTKNCWGYAPACTCGQSTEMGTGFKWTPHEVWE